MAPGDARRKRMSDGAEETLSSVRRLLRSLLVLAALAVGTAPALAAPTHIAAELVPERTVAAPGETVALALHMRPEPTWHGYWENPGDAGFGMGLAWSLPNGASTGKPLYPVPQTLLISGLMNHVYEREYAVLVPFTVPRGSVAGSVLPITVAADWLACTREVCVPEKAQLATTITVGTPGARDPRFDGWRRKLPAPMAETSAFALQDGKVRLAIPLPASLALARPHLFVANERVADYAAPQVFSRRGDSLIVELKPAAGAASPEALDAVLAFGTGDGAGGLTVRALPGGVPPAGTPLAGAASEPAAMSTAGLLALLGGALLGGLLLNVMPCVFPILSLKALSLAGTNADGGKARRDGLAYTAGVILACLALGAAMLGLRAAGEQVGWAFQLQEPLVVAGLLMLAIAITANLAGLYELPMLMERSGGGSAFATGLLAAFVATPCTGPFMAAAMGAALVLPPAAALAVFGALGLGLALPFLALALVPPLRRLMPRPGPWMVRFRHAMAVPMGLTALALAWLAWRIGGIGFLAASALLAVALIAVLVRIGRNQHAGRPAGRATAGFAALALLGVIALPPTVSATPPSQETDALNSRNFSRDALARARASGKPVFVYFTADWCLTCKVNERAAIESPGTAAAFRAAGVRSLRGDWTRREPEITRFLGENGAAGVPLYLWYSPNAPQGEVLPQLLTEAELVERARKI
ncbi:protein-disulfide reductase DsbD family protein [Novosphingobium tardum]|uniref:Protein-disulfide reductase DsbD family protein n=1 Tax=Novosphingobium tardum TaxID=1538021 RepID=A0ABV8RPX9_9SPHN